MIKWVNFGPILFTYFMSLKLSSKYAPSTGTVPSWFTFYNCVLKLTLNFGLPKYLSHQYKGVLSKFQNQSFMNQSNASASTSIGWIIASLDCHNDRRLTGEGFTTKSNQNCFPVSALSKNVMNAFLHSTVLY